MFVESAICFLEARKGCWIPAAEVTDNYKLSNMSAGNRTWDLRKSRMCFTSLNHSPALYTSFLKLS